MINNRPKNVDIFINYSTLKQNNLQYEPMSLHNKTFLQLLNNGIELSNDETKRFKNLWKET